MAGYVDGFVMRTRPHMPATDWRRSPRASATSRSPIGLGHGNAEIAATLHLSVATVKAHVSRRLDKLEVDNRVQIALLVQAAGEH